LLHPREWNTNRRRPEAILVRLSPDEYRLLHFGRHVHKASIAGRLREVGLADARKLLGLDATNLGLAPPTGDAAVEPSD
jgi:hypothetical protein